MLTYAGAIRQAADRLRGAGVESARLDAEILLASAAGLDRSGVFARLPDVVPAAVEARFAQFVARRCRREPVAYIVEEKEFYSLSLMVSAAVLVPRPETEMLVEAALEELPAGASLCDVGTGSGCIAIAVAVARPDVWVAACDLSRPALAMAARNAARHGVAGRVALVCADLARAIRPGPRFDVIVANPPYVADGEELAAELDFEPRAALRGGADGLDVICRLVPQASARLKPRGRAIVEFGAGQERAVRDFAVQAGFAPVEIRRDLAGHARVMVATLPAVSKADSRAR
jgi:release factor glutamine methyltransferase